jgi:transposase, IS5 family
MPWKQTQQASLADALIVEHKSLSGLNDVHNIVNWHEIEKIPSNLYSSTRACSLLLMLKMPIIQAWYKLECKKNTCQELCLTQINKYINITMKL